MEQTIYKKIYGISGFVEKSIVLPINKVRIRINFMNGIVNADGITPARFSTNDTIVQTAIENSKLYKEGQIKLIKKISIGKIGLRSQSPKIAEEQVVDTHTNPQAFVYPEVKNVQAAKDVLMTTFGVSLSELQNKEQTLGKASELGVSFPNLK